MPDTAQITRFAPSPTGALHLGNARTALFSWLAARASGGRFVLRVEDTDAGRSQDALLERQLDELRWLGITWDEGPGVGGPHGPYRQSERSSIYAEALPKLAANGQTYPCFCSPEELQLSRKTQLAAGRPPRYARTCAGLSAAEVQRRIDAGKAPAIRFRVPDHRTVEFVDRVHGPQRFQSDDIGDFVIRRADGSVSFFLGNAVDDSAMGITLVLRGDDHLANTPRQLLLLEALGMPLPEYGHLPLVLAPSGTPLSKREGAASLTDLRAQGYLPAAICNYLVRLGHACGHDGWLAMDQLASHFDLARTSHSAARFDDAQLRHWQREAVTHSTDAQIEQWLGHAPRCVAGRRGAQRVRRGGEGQCPVSRRGRRTRGRGRQRFGAGLGGGRRADRRGGTGVLRERAASCIAAHAGDFKAWTRAIAEATGRKGAKLFMPLRSALTGATHGPELAPLVGLMGTAACPRPARTARSARRKIGGRSPIS